MISYVCGDFPFEQMITNFWKIWVSDKIMYDQSIIEMYWEGCGVAIAAKPIGSNPKTIPKTIPSYSCSSIVVRCAGVHFMKLDDFPEVSNSGEAIFWFKIFGQVTW